MNWYGLLKKSAYERWMDQIEQLSMQNPYPFNSWFDESGRTYIPFETESLEQMYDNNDMAVIETLEESGCTDIDYRNGYCTYNNNKYRIGKLLEYLRRKDLQELGQKAERGEIYNIERDIEQANKWYNDLLGYFTNSSLRVNKGENTFAVVISQDPHDVAKMSTDRHWDSCMELGEGSNYESVFCEVSSGGLVAYLIYNNDTDIQNPLARIHIRRFENGNGQSVAIPEASIYGNEIAGFSEIVDQWLTTKQGTELEPGMYSRMGGEYSDTFGDTTLVAPVDEEGLLLWLKKEDPNAVSTTYSVDDQLAEAWNEYVEDIYMGDDNKIDDYGKKFTNKEEAEKYFESVSQYVGEEEEHIRQQMGNEEELELTDWFTFNEDEGDYELPRYKLYPHVHDYRHEMQSYAIKEFLRQEKGSFSPEVIQIVHDIIFGGNHLIAGTNDKYISGFLSKYPEYATDEDLNNIEDKTVLKSYDSLSPEQQASLKQQYTDTIITTLENPEVLITHEMRRRNTGRNSIDYILPSRFHDMVLAPLELMYKPIPEPIIRKIVDFAAVTELGGRDISREQQQYIWPYMAGAFSRTKSDTPTVQRFYKSLLPYWKENHRYYGEEENGPINVGSFGYNLATLGENGKDFLPFLNEKLQLERERLVEAEETARQDPEGGPKSPIRLHWPSLVKRLEKNIENYLYIINYIETGKPSGKYKFHN